MCCCCAVFSLACGEYMFVDVHMVITRMHGQQCKRHDLLQGGAIAAESCMRSWPISRIVAEYGEDVHLPCGYTCCCVLFRTC